MDLSQTLLTWRNADGGWGYSPGRRSRIEPTFLAALALDTGVAAAWSGWPRRSGWLVDGEGLPVNFGFNGLALVAVLARADAVDSRADALARALLDVKGVAFDRSEALAQDNRLQAWPWVEGTFSWVEPTAWCVLALKKWAARASRRGGALEARVDEAERLLFDRVCETGGWNYGNARVFDRALQAYVPTTALALLALQDRADHPRVVKSLAFLGNAWGTERSSGSLALASIALRVFGRPEAALRAALPDAARVAEGLGQTVGVALANYALREDHDLAAFRI